MIELVSIQQHSKHVSHSSSLLRASPKAMAASLKEGWCPEWPDCCEVSNPLDYSCIPPQRHPEVCEENS